ncbi:hypothetical protein L1S35_03590 [Flavobacterium sp. AS60]|uniref:hypothetical protein n=1 Tax=Flavobacterium anseongense TaxID=2910677 RepID=UPI001F46DE08|nr:hypothetical protein [Flavobacterium sp. AS60]MCF6128739.1 hypothetical protein [Flavobacterium sp. AS60]
MKKFTLVLAFIGMITLGSCSTNDDNVDNDTISEVFELRNINFGFDGGNSYSIYQVLNPQIYPSDVILIYRLSGTIDSSTPIWQLIPRTLYLDEGELDYDFDFSKEDFTIYAGGTYDLTLTSSYITNQTFRIVIVPGYFSNKKGIDYSDYDAVAKAFHIDESKIKVLNK